MSARRKFLVVSGPERVEVAVMGGAQSEPRAGSSTLRETVNLEIQRVHRYGGALSLLCATVDDKDWLRDIYGTEIDSTADSHLLDLVWKQCRAVDAPFFEDGRVFVVLPGTGMDGATRLARRILECLERTPLHIGMEELVLGASVGLSEMSAESSADGLIEAAESALDWARRDGGGGCFPEVSERADIPRVRPGATLKRLRMQIAALELQRSGLRASLNEAMERIATLEQNLQDSESVEK